MRPDHFAGYIAAWLMAALVPTAIGAVLFDGHAGGIHFIFLVTLAHVLLIALPLFRYFSNRSRVNALTCTLGAAAVAAGPVGLLSQFSLWGMESGSISGIPTAVDGLPTLAGILVNLGLISGFACIGAAAGICFWLTLRLSGAYTREGKPALRDFVFEPVPVLARRPGSVLGVVAVLATAGILALPTITKSLNCHARFWDNHGKNKPQLTWYLRIPDEEWPRLKSLFETFGHNTGMSFQGSTRDDPGTYRGLALNLCTDEGVVVDVNEQRWLRPELERFQSKGEVRVRIFSSGPSADWLKTAHTLLGELEAVWPEGVRFFEGGRQVPKPEVLK